MKPSVLLKLESRYLSHVISYPKWEMMPVGHVSLTDLGGAYQINKVLYSTDLTKAISPAPDTKGVLDTYPTWQNQMWAYSAQVPARGSSFVNFGAWADNRSFGSDQVNFYPLMGAMRDNVNDDGLNYYVSESGKRYQVVVSSGVWDQDAGPKGSGWWDYPCPRMAVITPQETRIINLLPAYSAGMALSRVRMYKLSDTELLVICTSAYNYQNEPVNWYDDVNKSVHAIFNMETEKVTHVTSRRWGSHPSYYGIYEGCFQAANCFVIKGTPIVFVNHSLPALSSGYYGFYGIPAYSVKPSSGGTINIPVGYRNDSPTNRVNCFDTGFANQVNSCNFKSSNQNAFTSAVGYDYVTQAIANQQVRFDETKIYCLYLPRWRTWTEDATAKGYYDKSITSRPGDVGIYLIDLKIPEDLSVINKSDGTGNTCVKCAMVVDALLSINDSPAYIQASNSLSQIGTRARVSRYRTVMNIMTVGEDKYLVVGVCNYFIAPMTNRDPSAAADDSRILVYRINPSDPSNLTFLINTPLAPYTYAILFQGNKIHTAARDSVKSYVFDGTNTKEVVNWEVETHGLMVSEVGTLIGVNQDRSTVYNLSAEITKYVVTAFEKEKYVKTAGVDITSYVTVEVRDGTGTMLAGQKVQLVIRGATFEGGAQAASITTDVTTVKIPIVITNTNQLSLAASIMEQ